MEWRSIPFNTKYLVSNTGLIKNSKTNKILKPWIVKVGYQTIRLGGKSKNYTIHSIVALTFIGPNQYGLDINHIDGNKLNNNVENLEYVTRSENLLHSFKLELSKKRLGHKTSQGSKNSMAKLKEPDIIKIRQLYATNNYSYSKLGEMYNVNLATIGYIIQRKTWKNVD